MKKVNLNLQAYQERGIDLTVPMMRSLVTYTEGEEEKEKYIFKGSAAVLDSWSHDLGGFREKIHSGSFKNTSFKRCIANFNHREDYLLGTVKSGTLRINVTDGGVDVEIDEADTTISRDCKTWVERGEIDGMSFKFYLADTDGSELTYNESTKMYEHNIYNIKEVMDVALVVRQSYNKTKVGMSLARQIDLENGISELTKLQEIDEKTRSEQIAKVQRAKERTN